MDVLPQDHPEQMRGFPYDPARTAGFCVLSGCALGMLGYVAAPTAFPRMISPALLLSAGMGLLVGFACAFAVAPLLIDRDLSYAKPILVYPVMIFIVLIAPFVGNEIKLMLWSGGAFIVAGLVARFIAPRTWSQPGVCRSCGYDLRASHEFGRCPEMGMKVCCSCA